MYLHSLSSHAPEQYELVCKKSLNTENQERLLVKSHRIAERASNRHPENVIMSIMMHIQVRHEIYLTTHGSETSIRKLAVHLPDFGGTFLSHEFATKHKDSYQAHLQRISPFLLQGPGVWWSNVESGYTFHDGDSCPSSSLTGPLLLYCRENNVHLHQDETWKYIIEKIIQLPISEFKLYTDEGDYVTTCTYENDTENEMCEDIIATVPPGDGDTFATPCIATSLFANMSQDFLIATTADTTDGQSMHNQQLSVSNLEEPSAVPLRTQCHQLPATVSKPCTLHVPELKIKLCRAIANCTGLTDELKGLDNLRHKLKTDIKKSTSMCSRH